MATPESTRLEQIADLAIPELYKLLKAEDLTREEIAAIEAKALPDDVDHEDENVQKMVGALTNAKAKVLERERAAAEVLYAAQLQRAKDYLKEAGVPGADDLPESALFDIAKGLEINEDAEANPGVTEPVVVITQDDDINALVTPSGEVIGFIDAPNDDLERRLILEWLGEKLTYLDARGKGLASEKQAWLDRINRIYDPQINRVNRGSTYAKMRYQGVAQNYLDDIRTKFMESQKSAAKPKEAPKSVKVGLLMLQYTKDRASIQIVDEALAILTLTKLKVTEALKTTVSILKTGIPDAIRAKLPEDRKGDNGLFFYPGGVEKFDFK